MKRDELQRKRYIIDSSPVHHQGKHREASLFRGKLYCMFLHTVFDLKMQRLRVRMKKDKRCRSEMRETFKKALCCIFGNIDLYFLIVLLIQGIVKRKELYHFCLYTMNCSP